MPLNRGRRRRRYHTVATLLIAPADVSNHAAKRFVKTPEIDSLLSLRYHDIAESKRLYKHIPTSKIRKAKSIYHDSKVRPGYLHCFLLNKRPDLVRSFINIPSSHRFLCQVECPTRSNRRYKNIDVGATSNGRYENRDHTMVDCAIRETLEEAGLILKRQYFSEDFQLKKRQQYGMEDLPLNFTYGSTFCFIIVL